MRRPTGTGAQSVPVAFRAIERGPQTYSEMSGLRHDYVPVMAFRDVRVMFLKRCDEEVSNHAMEIAQRPPRAALGSEIAGTSPVAQAAKAPWSTQAATPTEAGGASWVFVLLE